MQLRINLGDDMLVDMCPVRPTSCQSAVTPCSKVAETSSPANIAVAFAIFRSPPLRWLTGRVVMGSIWDCLEGDPAAGLSEGERSTGWP